MTVLGFTDYAIQASVPPSRQWVWLLALALSNYLVTKNSAHLPPHPPFLGRRGGQSGSMDVPLWHPLVPFWSLHLPFQPGRPESPVFPGNPEFPRNPINPVDPGRPFSPGRPLCPVDAGGPVSPFGPFFPGCPEPHRREHRTTVQIWNTDYSHDFWLFF